MKKKVLLAMAVIMALGTVKAMAQEANEDWIQMDITEGKIAAAELANETEQVKNILKEMNKMQDELAESKNSRGLMSAIGQTVGVAESVMQDYDTDLDKMRQLKIELRKKLSDFKAMDERNMIPGLHVHEELSF